MAFVKRITIIGDSPANEIEENWLVFERNVSHQVNDNQQTLNNVGLAIQIAFQVSDYEQNGRPNIVKLNQSNLNVFFPTEKETHLGFLAQGPYRTTPARDNVPQGDPFNISLAEETGELVVEALRWLRDRDWLTVDVLETLPLAYIQRESGYHYVGYRREYGYYDKEHNRYKHTLFAPIYERVKQAMMNEALIPAYGGGYVAAKDAKIAGSVDLRELLDMPRLQQLFDFDDQTQWLSDEITEGKTRDLWHHLTTLLDVEEIDAEMFVRRINQDFMSNQSDDWIRRFYEFAPSGHTMQNILGERPIIRLADCTHVKPFRGKAAQAYLPTEHESRYPTVKREICDSEKALAFLKKLGLKEPGIVDEVLTHILPKYRGEQEIDDAEGTEHQRDIEFIVEALGVDSQSDKTELAIALKSTPFLWATNAVGESAFRKPGSQPGEKLYFRNPTLEMYFEGNPDAWFVSSQYEQYIDDLKQLKIFHRVVRWLRQQNRLDGIVTIKEEWGDHERGLDGFDPNFRIDGLEFALDNPTVERSIYIWNTLLRPRKQSIVGTVESSTVQSYPSDKTSADENVQSDVGRLVRKYCWLPDGNGNFVKPSELSLEDLPDEFRRDDELAHALGMDTSRFNIDDAPDDIQAIVAAAQGRSPEELKEALDLLDEKKEKERETVETLDPDDYPSELEGVFEQPDNQDSGPRPIPDRPSAPDISPEDRLYSDVENEPEPDERYKLRIRRIWQPRNPETRRFLEREYEGRCQICDYTFEQRNRTYYFEAVHLVPRIKAEWADDRRNAICLCANHSAQFQYGELSTPESDILEQIRSPQEGQEHSLLVMLCGEPQLIRFSAKHMDEFRGLLGDT